MVCRRGLLGVAYRRASAASAGLREFLRMPLAIRPCRSVRVFGQDGLERTALPNIFGVGSALNAVLLPSSIATPLEAFEY